MKAAALAAFAALILVSLAYTNDNIDVYVKDGQLRAPLIIRDVQVIAKGLTGTVYKFETDGTWTVSQVKDKTSTLKMQGTLTKEQVEVLAKELAKHDLVNLKNFGGPAPNPHLVGIEFGRINAVCHLLFMQPLPKGASGGTATMPERFGGIMQASQEIITRRR